jgi:carbonic anhydrase
MKYLPRLFANNRDWSKSMTDRDPQFFTRLASIQKPDYLWIGCSDSRVPANQIIGLMPGEVFVHRNVANIVAPGDLNGNSVIQFAVDMLKVKHIIVCGHYGCGGVWAALRDDRLGLVDRWLDWVRQVRDRHARLVDALPDESERWRRLCELNTIEQVMNVCRLPTVCDAWARGQELDVHGWIYDLHDGLLRDLEITVGQSDELDLAYRVALAKSDRLQV